jgi:FKBP-type peptidyl-prolyl cis-trans isomerase
MKYITFLPLLLILVTGTVLTTACSQQTLSPIGISNVTELIKTDVKLGTGAEATSGQRVSVHYTGWLYDETATSHKGKRFDSSLDRGKPFKFILGVGRVIQGWDQGVQGMKVGGKRTLTIPAEMGYGARGAGTIPPNAPLIFDVQLMSVN